MPRIQKRKVGGFTKFFRSRKEQKEFESLQMQMIIYFDDDFIPWE